MMTVMTYVWTFLAGWVAGVIFFSWRYQRRRNALWNARHQ